MLCTCPGADKLCADMPAQRTITNRASDHFLSVLQSHSRRPGDAAFEDALREALLVERGLAHPLEGAPAGEEAVWTLQGFRSQGIDIEPGASGAPAGGRACGGGGSGVDPTRFLV